MGERATIVATTSKSMFRQECTVSAVIRATPEKIWRLLTNAGDMVRWNSTLTSMDGTIALGGTVRMAVPEAPGRVFSILVTRYASEREMVWEQGNRVMFRGVRTYRLTRKLNPLDPGCDPVIRAEIS